MKRIFILIATIAITIGSIKGQNQSKHEISVWGAGGISRLKYNTDIGGNKGGFGGSLGIGYNYSFTDQWSIGTGLELSLYNAKTTFDSYSDSYNSNDGEYDFQFRTAVTNYEEKQNVAFMNIPLAIQFQLPVFEKNYLYLSGGVKFGIPVIKKYTVTKATMKNSGYYPQWSEQAGRELVMDTQEFMGFGIFNKDDIKGDLDLKPACILTLEAGMKWKIGKNLSCYTGMYFDYGLNSINKNNSKKMVQYNTPDPVNFINNSIIQTELTDKIIPMGIGIKLRLSFGM